MKIAAAITNTTIALTAMAVIWRTKALCSSVDGAGARASLRRQ
jgi:hypothetical protein